MMTHLRRPSYVLVLAVTCLTAATLGARQTPAPPAASPAAPSAPGPQRGRGGLPAVKSPELGTDGRVTFRLRAPGAKEVVVNVAGRRLPLERNDQGVWTVTTDPLAPDYYTYTFGVDGTTMNDPANRQVQTSFGSFQSMLVVPGPQPWLPAAGVPRGAITRHAFHSAVANDDRDFYVYTPPGYEARRASAYPLVFLLHGLGDDAERWMNGGGANVILDNLIAQGKATPMVMVTTLGYGVDNGPAGAMAPENLSGYTRILLEEVLPMVERSYNVSRSREQRAIAGLSMGGAETLYTALNHLDKFAWIGSFSGAFVMLPGAGARDGGPPAGPAAPPAADAAAGRGGRGAPPVLDEAIFAKNFPRLDAKANSQIKMLWIVCGTADSLIGVNRQLKGWLKSKNVAFTELEVPDVGHVWPLWRQNFADFAQKVFRGN
jgi:enterochelin esterase-like enzyme